MLRVEPILRHGFNSFSLSIYPTYATYIFRQNINSKSASPFVTFQLTPWEALKAELLFAINISIVTKPVHNRLSESESPKSASHSQKSRSRLGSEARSSLKEKSDRSINFNNGTNGFTARNLSGGLNRIGNFFGKNNSD